MAADNEGYIKEDITKGEDGTHHEKKKDLQGPGMKV
jgi:hypothetical protein